MRRNIVHPGAEELRYEIRSIVTFAEKLQKAGVDITWENIGDPVAKGEHVPEWIREIVARQITDDEQSMAYSPTKGLLKTRQFLAEKRSKETGQALHEDNILFFNGLGDAIQKVYTWLSPTARVLGPSPAYPTHSSIEGAHGRSEHMTYLLEPNRGWMPDMDDVRNKVKYNPSISALLIINPDNPTGAVYSKEVLQEFVAIAKEYDLFLIADEIYANLAYDEVSFTSLASMSGDVPTMIMRGLSKEVPWPGSRCGWVEFYNTDKDPLFARYAKSIEDAKMNEVCSTTLPQAALPHILSDEKYDSYVATRRGKYQMRAKQATETLSVCRGLSVVQPQGAFYLSVTFTDDFSAESLLPMNQQAKELLEAELASEDNMPRDKKFCLQLLAATGICTVPLSSGFNSHVEGFRMTLLENDDDEFAKTLQNIVKVLQ